MTFVLAHLTDPHIGAPRWPRPGEALSKVGLEGAIWHLSRRRSFDMLLLARVIEDIRMQRPDHIAVTGDVVNAGLSSEFRHSRKWLAQLGETHNVSFVPGNHDTTTSRSAMNMRDSLDPWMIGDGELAAAFPYMKVRGPVALIGLSSAVATPVFFANGRLGASQLDKAASLLRHAKERGLCRVVMIHHPPVAIAGQRRRGLDDHALFGELIRTCGAELVLHGHQHVSSLAHLPSPTGATPVVGAPCASADPRSGQAAAGYNLYKVETCGDGWSIEMRARRIDHSSHAIDDDVALGML